MCASLDIERVVGYRIISIRLRIIFKITIHAFKLIGEFV